MLRDKPSIGPDVSPFNGEFRLPSAIHHPRRGPHPSDTTNAGGRNRIGGLANCFYRPSCLYLPGSLYHPTDRLEHLA